MNWACRRCGTVHTQNPERCRDCGTTTLEPVREGDTPESETSGPEPIKPDETRTYGTTPDPDYESSPDVAVDGSVGEGETNLPQSETAEGSRIGGVARKFLQTLSATVRAPFGLLRDYLIPILAFVVVTALVLWVLA